MPVSLSMMTELDFLNFTRGIASGPVTLDDVDRARDVFKVQLLLYSLGRMIGATEMVEIGTMDGSTSVPLLMVAEETGGVVHSVDPSPCEEARSLIRRCELFSHWQFHEMLADDFFRSYPNRIHLAFIDGDHRFQAVTNDALNVWDRLERGGFMVFHDWSPCNPADPDPSDPASFGVMRALRNTHRHLLRGYAMPIMPNAIGHAIQRPPVTAEGGIFVMQKALHDHEHKTMVEWGYAR